jgi:hypothetical protein
MTGFVTTLTVALALSSGQADGVALRWKLKEGDTFYVKQTDTMEQTVGVLGQNQEQKTDSTTVSRFKVTKADAAGYTLEQTILDSVTETNVIPGGLGDFDKKIKGTTFTVTLDKDFKATKIDGVSAAFDKVVQDNPAVKPIVASILHDETVKKAVQDLFRVGPDKAVKVGDAWKVDEVAPLGASGELATELAFKLATAKDGVAEVAYTGTAKFSPPKEPSPDVPFTITKADFKSDKFTGTIKFDTKAARMTASESTMTLAGTMTLKVGEMELAADIKSKATSKTEILDKNPVVN